MYNRKAVDSYALPQQLLAIRIRTLRPQIRLKRAFQHCRPTQVHLVIHILSARDTLIGYGRCVEVLLDSGIFVRSRGLAKGSLALGEARTQVRPIARRVEREPPGPMSRYEQG